MRTAMLPKTLERAALFAEVDGPLVDLMELAEEFVREGRKDVLWGPRTAEMYRQIFERLLNEPAAGALVHSPGIGFACAIEPPYDAAHGRTATGFGIYVRPAYRGSGLGAELHSRLLAQLRRRSFAALVTGSDTAAGAAILAGIEPVSSYGVIRLGGGR